eukprot:1474074-Rhodomonas_salina.3
MPGPAPPPLSPLASDARPRPQTAARCSWWGRRGTSACNSSPSTAAPACLRRLGAPNRRKTCPRKLARARTPPRPPSTLCLHSLLYPLLPNWRVTEVWEREQEERGGRGDGCGCNIPLGVRPRGARPPLVPAATLRPLICLIRPGSVRGCLCPRVHWSVVCNSVALRASS